MEIETKPNQGVNILMLWIVHIMLQMDDKVCPFLSNIIKMSNKIIMAN